MTRLEFLNGILPLISPTFYTRYNKGLDEFVFLGDDSELPYVQDDSGHKISTFLDADRTSCEAINNHFHLFFKLKPKEYALSEKISKAIAQNLFTVLSSKYPSKQFVVYLEFNPTDSTIIRFHQKWENELPYINQEEEYPGTKVFVWETR